MSGRRDRSVLETLLRGGAVGRRIRVKAVLLSSSRGDLRTLRDWVKFESAKGFIPVGLAAFALYLKAPLPLDLFSALLAAAVVWACFVAYHAYSVAFRMNRRHAAYMKAAGVDTDFQSILSDKTLSADGLTMREFIAARKRPPTATEPA